LTNLASKEPYDKQDYFKQYQKSFQDGESLMSKLTNEYRRQNHFEIPKLSYPHPLPRGQAATGIQAILSSWIRPREGGDKRLRE